MSDPLAGPASRGGRFIPEKYLKQIEEKVQRSYKVGFSHGIAWGAVAALLLVCVLDLIFRRRRT